MTMGSGHRCRCHDDGDEGRHEQHVMPGEEHVVKWGDAGQYQRDEKPREHDPCDLGSKLLLGDASDRLIGGYDALSPQRSLDHLSQRPERVDN